MLYWSSSIQCKSYWKNSLLSTPYQVPDERLSSFTSIDMDFCLSKTNIWDQGSLYRLHRPARPCQFTKWRPRLWVTSVNQNLPKTATLRPVGITRNIKCRFHFGQFFTNRTIVADRTSFWLSRSREYSGYNQKQILSLAKGKIDDLLNPSKSDYDLTLTEADIFTSVNITEPYLSLLTQTTNYTLEDQ